MPPDLNSVPLSPRPDRTSRSSSRPTSQLFSPTSPTMNILPSNQSIMSPSVPTGTGGAGVVDAGPGPLRHPRPLTAADLHMQLEKEQEAVVNRLTRELAILRAAQNASVVSNSSSTSAGFPDSGDHHSNHMLSGPSHPQLSTRRHHRSSSSTSTRSLTATSGSTAWTTAGIAGSVSGAIPSSSSRISVSRQNSNNHPTSLSRQNSTTSSRRSGASSPAPLSAQPSYQHNDYFPTLYQARPTPRDIPMSHSNSQQGSHLDPHAQAATTVPTTGRYEEMAYHRHELEATKRENEALKRRIKELERTIRTRRQSDASRTRSESVSTTASANVAAASGLGRGREREKEADDEPVRVGESARSGGLR